MSNKFTFYDAMQLLMLREKEYYGEDGADYIEMIASEIESLESQLKEAKVVQETLNKLHEEKIGTDWIWVAITRIVVGEPEKEVMADYGYVLAKDAEFYAEFGFYPK